MWCWRHGAPVNEVSTHGPSMEYKWRPETEAIVFFPYNRQELALSCPRYVPSHPHPDLRLSITKRKAEKFG